MANRDSSTVEPASKIFPNRILVNVALMPQVATGRPSRPEPPEFGPQAQYSLTGHNIGMRVDPFVTFEDDKQNFRMDLEWILFNLERFDEPSRHIILAGTAIHFGMPFENVMGGML
ncbi:MAG: hypothetical protein M3Y65_16985 [Pseudomonadota bacterium]|nr:hypothetical protein [Pseudomonadota bacterium]